MHFDAFDTAPALGPFVLERHLGTGGMGEVWRGLHRSQQVPIAIKLIRRPWGHHTDYHAAFRREVRAVAGLDHPGIVRVFDYGHTNQTLMLVDGTPLDAGSPYLVMEVVERGSLERFLPALTWPKVRHVVLGVLEALSHAHARGIIHRDMKPGNVLLAGKAGEVARVKLTDFGVAHALTPQDDDLGQTGFTAGTPAYMPPEQIVGSWRDFGPWTDLYALACMIWELCTGKPPYAADNLARLSAMHLFEPTPRLEPRFEVPPGLERWLRRLLRKHTWERFPTASDAAWALRIMEPGAEYEPWVWTRTISEDQSRREPTQVFPEHPWRKFTTLAWGAAPTEKLDDVAYLGELPTESAESAEHSGEPPGRLQPLHPTTELPTLRPPMPHDWREIEPRVHPDHARPLAGAGLGLYPLREVPLIGREPERDALWRALVQVHTTGAPRVVVVRGLSGVGKSRLVEWLTVRAEERGVAHVMKATHSMVDGPHDGLAPMFARDMRTTGLTRAEAYERLSGHLRRELPQAPPEVVHFEAASQVEFLGLPEEVDPRAQEIMRVRLGSDRERHDVLGRHIKRSAQARPVLVWLDDAMWSISSLSLVDHVLGSMSHGDFPALFVLTVRDDLVAERPLMARVLEKVRAHHLTATLDVAALGADAHRALLEEMLGFDSELIEEIQQRTLGNPLFAVQLVGDWVARGLLYASGSGFRLTPGAEVQLPDDLHTLWKERVGRLIDAIVLEQMVDDVHHALGLAACLGLAVDQREWEMACMLAEVVSPPGFVDLMIAQRLAQPTDQGFAFVHGMLRESILRMASERGRYERDHECVAQALRALYGEHAVGHAMRMAYHLMEAGQEEDALAPLLDASYQLQISGHYDDAARALEQHDDVVRKLGLPEDDGRRLRAQMQLVWLTWLRGQRRVELQDTVRAIMRRAGAREETLDVLGECLRWRGLVARFEQRYDESLEHLERAYACFERVEDDEGAARTALSMAVGLREVGRLDEAEALLIEAVRLAERCDLFILLPRCFGNLAEVAMERGEWIKARERFERAHRVAEDAGDPKAAAFSLNGLGELELTRGDFDEARARFAKAEQVFSALGSRYAHVPRLNGALTLLMTGEEHVERARQVFEEILAHSDGRDVLEDALAHLGLAACAAYRGVWSGPLGWDAHVERARELSQSTEAARRTLVLASDFAAELAGSRDQPGRARALEGLALSQELRLDRDEEE